jgi:type II secretory pathway component PulJ
MIAGGVRHISSRIRRWSAWARLVGLAHSERGISVPEILVATVIAASVAGLLGTTVYQFFRATTDGRNHLAVQNSLGNASLWLGRDATEAGSFSPGSGSTYGTFITGEPSIKFRYSYDAGQRALVRESLLDDAVETTQAVARNIESQSDVVFSVDNALLTITITATSPDGNVSETTTLNLAMRVR